MWSLSLWEEELMQKEVWSQFGDTLLRVEDDSVIWSLSVDRTSAIRAEIACPVMTEIGVPEALTAGLSTRPSDAPNAIPQTLCPEA
jgi:hypothetical protein